jgi:hypothetical protein
LVGVGGCKACDLRNFIGRQPLEVQDDDFAIERRESLDEGVQSLQDLSCVDLCCDVCVRGRELGIVQSRKLSRFAAPAAQDMRGRDVVCHAIDPGSQAAPSSESSQTPSQREIDLLHQVLLQSGIGLVRPHQPRKRCGEVACDPLEQHFRSALEFAFRWRDRVRRTIR